MGQDVRTVTRAARPPADEVRLHGRLVLLFAIACGASAASIYYAQPLLSTIAHALHTGEGTTGLVITTAQIGFATGVMLIVPLGDLAERRPLVVRLLLACALALAVCAAAPSVAVLAAAAAAVGLTSVVAQVLVPFAGDLASDHERGRVVGTVMSGLLIGILVARTVSGLVAEVGGWRAPYVLGALGMVALAAALHRALPDVQPRTTAGYWQVLASVPALVREEPILRRRMAYGALGMAAFSVLWTALTFLLSGPPYQYGEATIGLFGLAGLAGAGAAQGAGRIADRGRGHAATAIFWLVIAGGWGLCALGRGSLLALIVGIVLIDAGVQGQHITNQSTIYSLRPGARSRLTMVYMTGNFIAGAIGTALAAAAWTAGGWKEVAALGAGIGTLGLLVWGHEHLGRRARLSRESASRAPAG
jgi:predicted MFS family arabinose efflux permease